MYHSNNWLGSIQWQTCKHSNRFSQPVNTLKYSDYCTYRQQYHTNSGYCTYRQQYHTNRGYCSTVSSIIQTAVTVVPSAVSYYKQRLLYVPSAVSYKQRLLYVPSAVSYKQRLLYVPSAVSYYKQRLLYVPSAVSYKQRLL